MYKAMSQSPLEQNEKIVSTAAEHLLFGELAEDCRSDDAFLRRLCAKALPDVDSSSVDSKTLMAQFQALFDEGKTAGFLKTTFYDPKWLYKDGFEFLHRGDTAVPADSHHNLIAMWTKVCIHALGMGDDPVIGLMLPPGRARKFASQPLVDLCFGAGIRAAGGPTVERMNFMQASVRAAFVEVATHAERTQRKKTQPQLVVVGGGFDSLPLRDFLPTGTAGFELDLPAVVACKRRMLHRYAAEFPAEAHRVPRVEAVDLMEERPSEALARLPTWSSSEPTVFVIEAVMFYLSEERRRVVMEDVSRLMRQCSFAALVIWDELPDNTDCDSADFDSKEDCEDVVSPAIAFARKALDSWGLEATVLEAPNKGFAMALAIIRESSR